MFKNKKNIIISSVITIILIGSIFYIETYSQTKSQLVQDESLPACCQSSESGNTKSKNSSAIKNGSCQFGSIFKILNFSDEQKNKISNIGKKYQKKYYKNTGDYKKIFALKIKHYEEIEKILTESQKKKLNEMNQLSSRGCCSNR